MVIFCIFTPETYYLPPQGGDSHSFCLKTEILLKKHTLHEVYFTIISWAISISHKHRHVCTAGIWPAGAGHENHSTMD